MTSLASDYVLALRLFMRTEEVSQRELARRLDVSEARVSQILNEPGNFTIATMERVAGALGADLHIEFRKRNGDLAMTTRQPLQEDVLLLRKWCDNDNPALGPDEIDALHSLFDFYSHATKTLLLIEALPVKWRRGHGGSAVVTARHVCAEQLEDTLDPKLWCGACGMASSGSCAQCGPGGPHVNSSDAAYIRDKCRLRDAKTWLHDIGTDTLHGSLPANTMATGLGHLAAMIERVEKLEQP